MRNRSAILRVVRCGAPGTLRRCRRMRILASVVRASRRTIAGAIMARLATILVLLVPQLALAESAAVSPEQLLNADSALYLRFDGVDAHRPAFDRTAFGEAVKGDFGDFVDYLGVILQDSVGPAILKQQLLDGTPTAKLGEIRRGFA